MEQFQLIQEKDLLDIESKGFLYEHVKTKARVLFLKNNDENRVFCIGFRTPPHKDHGVAHILEHSVLNGSEKFPIKDPFIQLGKTSLNTFLNAMTYPDKTLYPVASCNLKDLHNLMDVYMDAVFHPNIYTNPKIFEQEGWHYELFDKKEAINIKGVVYNEMKGAFSTPEQLLNRNIRKAMFPNHPYGFDSGGIPENIPELSYEEFLDFHKSHYHPSNSYIYYYGDIDIESELERLEGYLEGFEFQNPQSDLPEITPWSEPKEYRMNYPLMEEENIEEKNFFSLSYAFGNLTMKEQLVMSILEYILLDAPGALLKERLLELGLGEDIYGFFDNGIREHSFCVISKNVHKDREEEFFRCIQDTLSEIVQNGIEEKKIQAAINVYEFLLREGDYGSTPKGIVFVSGILKNWLYDKDLFECFEYDELFHWLRQVSSERYLELCIEKYFLNNPYRCSIIMSPSLTYNEEKEAELSEKLRQLKASMSEAEIDALIQHTEELLAYQNTADSKENLAKIPTLQIEDIDREKPEIDYEVEYKNGGHILYRKANTSGIVYVRVFFECNWLPNEQLQIANLLSGYLTLVSSENYHYSELADEINDQTGGISSNLSAYPYKDDSDHFRLGLEVKGKSFAKSLPKLLGLIEEILKNPKFEDSKRLSDLIKEQASGMQMSLISGGHISAITRALSYFSKNGNYNETVSGISYYDFIQHWKQAKEEDLVDFGMLMKKTLQEILQKAKITISVTYSAADDEIVRKELSEFMDKHQYDFDYIPEAERVVLGNQKEAFITSGNINFVAKASNYKKYGYTYSGSYLVANQLLNTDYLWNKVRVEGGAYGGMSSIRRNGTVLLMSYRDPNIAETYKTFEGIPAYFEQLDMTEEDVKNAVIGTLSGSETPLTPSMQNSEVMTMYLTELSHADKMQTRHEILDTKLEDLQKMSKLFENVLESDYHCTVGSKQSIEKNAELFLKVKEIN